MRGVRPCLCDDCPRCRLFHTRDDYNRHWGGPGLPVAAPPPKPRGTCRHRGQETRRESCGVCSGRVELKVLSCGVHGECTVAKPLPDVACCATCPDYQPVIQVECTSQGIGDGMVALCCATGLKRDHPEAEIVMACKPHAAAWVELFEGVDRVVTAAERIEPTYRPYANDDPLLARDPKPRWERQADRCGTRAVLPTPRPASPTEMHWAAPFAGRIALVPFAAWPDRTWPLTSWLELERLLMDQGYGCFVLDDRKGRIGAFQSPKVPGAPAAAVAAALRDAAAVVANDSGMAHVAGLLGRPTLALCGVVPGERIFGMYPTVRTLNGEGSVATLRAEDVAATVGAMIDHALFRTLRRFAPGVRSYLEIGVRDGDSLAVVLAVAPIERLALADNWSGNYGGTGRRGHEHIKRLLGEIGVWRGRVLWLDGDSKTTVPTLTETFDLVTVDGDHSAAGANADLENVLPLVAPGGVVILDDICHPAHRELEGVGLRFLQRHPEVTLEMIDRGGYGVMAFRKASGSSNENGSM